MALVDETLCRERHDVLENMCKEINSNTTELHNVIYKNGLISSIARIEATSNANSCLIKWNTGLVLLLITALLGATALVWKEANSLRYKMFTPWSIGVCDAE